MILTGILKTPTGFTYTSASVLLSSATNNYPFTTSSTGSYSVDVPNGTYSVGVLGGFNEYAHLGSIKVETGGSTDINTLLNQAVDSIDVVYSLAQPDGSDMVGNGIRTVGGKLSDFVSVRDYITTTINGTTSNQAGIEAAVAYCYANGVSLHWPKGTYVSTANIPNFHNVAHFGDGVVKRNTSLFKMNQRGGQRNIIYVSTTGSDINDGLDAAQPFLTVGTACTSILMGWEDNLLKGAWRVQLAAGTYPRATVLRAIRNAERFQVWGPEVSWGEPTAIIDNTLLEDSVTGLYLNTLDRWEVRNIKFTNFTGYQGQGVAASASSDFYCVNVWADNCGWAGIFMQGGEVFRVEGGKVTNCREGVVAYIGVRFTIGYNSSAHPTIIQGCTQAGFSAYNSSAGHVDYAEISNCSVGAAIINQSRIDFMGAKLMGNSVGIGADSMSTYIKNTEEDVLFNSGTPNALNERCRGNSLPNEFVNNFQFTPTTRVMRNGLGWSGASPVSTYKWVFEQQSGDSGITLLASGTELSSFAFGRPGNGSVGRISYDHAVDGFRFVAGNANLLFAASTNFRPAVDNAVSFGTASNRISTVYAATATINTSDERMKQQIKPVDIACLRAWAKVEYVQYKFNDSVEQKGAAARWHFGLIAQRVKKAFESEGLDAFEYGLLCFDETEDGLGRYGIRYEEALALECAYLRARLDNML